MAKKKQKKKNNDFWKQRAKEREQQGYDISNKSLERIKAEHDRMNAEMHKAVSELIAKYATDNQLTLNQAKQRLSATEKADLMIDLERFKELYGLNNPNYDEMLDRISTRVRISRLDAVNSQLDLMADYLAEQQLNELPNSMAKVYNEQYHKKMFDIQSRSGVGKSFTALSPLSQNVLSEYVGKVRADAFSRNLWGNTNKMVNEWKRTLEVGLSTGANTHTLMKQMSERTDVSYNRTKAMVRTETNYIYNQASAEVYKENEVEKYQFISTLDSVTTKICQELDLEEFNLNEIEVGENYPPMHYGCRSTTIEVLPDWMKEITESTRTARDDSGKTYEVPGDMDYKTWYNKYVDSSDIDKAYGDAERAEPLITKDLKDIANNVGVKLDGLDYRLKTKESLERKVNSDFSEYGGKFTRREVINKITDINRYTAILPPEKFVDNYKQFLGEMTASGHKLIKCKNSWPNKLNPYKGVNCNFISPDGQKYELQFHTDESFKLKNGEMHKLYETFRSAESTEYKKKMAQKKMFELSSNLTVPKDIEKIR